MKTQEQSPELKQAFVDGKYTVSYMTLDTYIEWESHKWEQPIIDFVRKFPTMEVLHTKEQFVTAWQTQFMEAHNRRVWLQQQGKTYCDADKLLLG